MTAARWIFSRERLPDDSIHLIKKDELDTHRKESAKKRKYETAMKQKDFNETLKIISQLKKEN